MPAGSTLTGRFVRHDLMTTDQAKSLAFYRALFPEWQINSIEMKDAGTYHVISVGGQDAGGIVDLPPNAGLSSHWIPYVAVDDCDATVKSCTELGGTTVIPSLGLPGVGVTAVLRDDQGATFKPFQREQDITLSAGKASGQFTFDELLTVDMSKARSFYQTVFGWSSIEVPMGDTASYVLFRVGDQDVAGAMVMPDEAQASPHWLTCLYAEDIDERSRQVEDLGGITHAKPRDIPGVGRFAVHADPSGASFALFLKPH
jgi:hypothetical protein